MVILYVSIGFWAGLLAGMLVTCMLQMTEKSTPVCEEAG